MTEQESTQLAGLYAMYSAYYRMTLSDQVLRMYADDLSDLEYAPVKEAMEAYRRDPRSKTLPLPAQIREVLAPAKSVEIEARDTAAKIQGAVSKFGWNLPIEAHEYIGDAGWSVIQKLGGWQYICERLGKQIDMGVFQAQARDLVKSELLHPTPKPQVLALVSAEREQPLEIEGPADWRHVLEKLLKGQVPAKEDAGAES